MRSTALQWTPERPREGVGQRLHGGGHFQQGVQAQGAAGPQQPLGHAHRLGGVHGDALRQGAGFVKKLPSWAEHPPPRSAPRPARNYLVTCSRGALSEAAEAFQEMAEPELGGEGEAFTW